ncbi:MAG: DUF2200 domain-containing protein [Defluviitaleaceae bacterium]|nr:DUF2200 domain-containing protein [Defluviitaleaceae bacterium]
MILDEKKLKRIYSMKFKDVYPLYIAKVLKKNRTKEELDQIIQWLTGYTNDEIENHIEKQSNFEIFFKNATNYSEDESKITGTICGYKIEEIEDDIVKKMRQMDKIVDELAKGKSIEKIFRKL